MKLKANSIATTATPKIVTMMTVNNAMIAKDIFTKPMLFIIVTVMRFMFAPIVATATMLIAKNVSVTIRGKMFMKRKTVNGFANLA